MTITAEVTTGHANPQLAAAAALAAEEATIGELARKKAERLNAEDTAALLATDDQTLWTAERLSKAAAWATSEAFRLKGYRGQRADWTECRDDVVKSALGKAPAAPEPSDFRPALKRPATRSPRLAVVKMLRSPIWAALDHPLPTPTGAMPTTGEVNARWLKGEAMTWTKRRMADPLATAPADLKGKSAAAPGRRAITADDLAAALPTLTGKVATPLQTAFLVWAMSPLKPLPQGGGLVPTLSKAEACATVGLSESNADNFKRAARALKAVDLAALVDAAEAFQREAAADASDLTRALVWFTAAAQRQAARKVLDRGRLAIPATPERRYLGDGQWAEATRLPTVAAASYLESGPIRRRPLRVAAITWKAQRRTAARKANARRLTRLVRTGGTLRGKGTALSTEHADGAITVAFPTIAAPQGGTVRRYRPNAVATIAAPGVYRMATTIRPAAAKAFPRTPKGKAAARIAQGRSAAHKALTARQTAREAAWASTAPKGEPMPRSTAPSGTPKMHPRGVGVTTTPMALTTRQDLTARVALAEAAMASALAERPRRLAGTPLACPLTARPVDPSELADAGAWGEPMARPEGYHWR